MELRLPAFLLSCTSSEASTIAKFALLCCALVSASIAQGQTDTLYRADFGVDLGTIAPQTVFLPTPPDGASWAVSGEAAGSMNVSSGQFFWAYATKTCSWISELVFVAGHSSLELDVEMFESGTFSSTDSVNVIIIEDGVERLVSSQVDDFGTLSIVNEACTASVSLQVLIHVRTSNPLAAVFLDEVTITGTSNFADSDADGIDDSTDDCIDTDGDGICDEADAVIMLMDEDFSSYDAGTGIGRAADDEAGIAHVQGVSSPGGAGWALLGQEQTNRVEVTQLGGESFLKYQRTGSSFSDTTSVTLMSRSFDVTALHSPFVRLQVGEATDFTTYSEYTNGGVVCSLIEDGVEREVLRAAGAFNGIDSIIPSTAEEELTLVIRCYAQAYSEIRLERMAVFGTSVTNGTSDVVNCNDTLACNFMEGAPWDVDCEYSSCVTTELLYEANFNTDSGSGSSLSGASPDGWSATVNTDETIGAFITAGPELQFDTGGPPNGLLRTMTWMSDTILVNGHTALDFSANMSSIGPDWEAIVHLGNLDSLVIENPSGLVNFSIPLPSETSALAIRIEVSTTLKYKSFTLDDVILIGQCPDIDGDDICDGVDDCVGGYDVLGVCNGSCAADADADGICDDQDGCTDISACNFGDPGASACEYQDACGLCGGDGIPLGDCDCSGNQLDVCGVCGGNGIPEGDCDCTGNQLDGCGVCGGTGATWSIVTSALTQGQYITSSFVATANDPLGVIDVTMGVSGTMTSSNWASDLLIAIVAPDGTGVEWGGYGGVSYGQGYTAVSGWPASWDAAASSNTTWTASVDLSGLGLTGDGEWVVFIANGWVSTENTSSLNYDIDITLPTLCEQTIGCTNVDACNYDPAANVDDGTCILLPAGICGCSTTLNTTASLAGGESSAVASVANSGSLGFLQVTLEYSGAGDSWPSDLLLQLNSPSGQCIEFGGYSAEVTGGCESLGAGNFWPSSWGTSASGTYTGTLNVQDAALYGDGTWTVQLWNGYANSTTVSYDLTLEFFGVCEGGAITGCTDGSACNFNADATIDDGSCASLDLCGVCGGDNSDCSGCTDPIACNYDSTAAFLDESCLFAEDQVVGCCEYTVYDQEVDLAGAGQEYVWTVPASGIGGLGDFSITIDFSPTGSMRNQASHMLISFIDPNGLCYYFGGNETIAEGELSPYMAANNCISTGEFWPNDWNSSVPGIYSAELDLTGVDLGGSGDWEIAIHNGDINTSPAEYAWIEFSLEGLCYVEGCSQPDACNYTPNYTVAVDSLCVYPGNCEVCNSDGSVTLLDDDGDGVCNEDEVNGCADSLACNFDPLATEEDGTCDYCSCPVANFTSDLAGYGLEIDTVATDIGLVSDGLGNTIDLSGYSTYRLYVTMANADDFMNAVSGDANNPIHLTTTTSFYQHLVGGAFPDGINPLLFPSFPGVEYDSWVTIGIDQQADLAGGESDIQSSESPFQPWIDSFESGSDISMDDEVGGIWFVLQGAANGVAGDDLRVLIAQLTTDGDLSGILYTQILEHGDGVNGTLNPTFSFIPPNACGCTDAAACNYDADADHDDGSCYYPDECGVCDGPGAIYACGCSDIPEGDCDCNGNMLDQCGICGGTGIPEGECDCDGNVLDECGVCGGAGIAAGECDCDGNVLDGCGVCGGTGLDIDGDGICDDIDNCTDTTAISFADEGNIHCLYYGCVDPTADNYDPDPSVIGCEMGLDQCCIWYGCTDDGNLLNGICPACNYDPQANSDDGSCEYISCLGCTDAGACNYDATASCDDGSCDFSCQGCTNPCSGNYDPNATMDDGSCQPTLGCMDSAACNYDSCADLNYGCDYLDVCGVCDGPGAIYTCGCADIPEGDCDCDGNQLDAAGICGGDCLLDADGDGICDWPPGCMEVTACNYDAAAIWDDGSCEWCSCSTDTCTQCEAASPLDLFAISLFGPDADISDDQFFVPTDDGLNLTTSSNGTAVLHGTLIDTSNPDAGLTVSIHYDGGIHGADWRDIAGSNGFNHQQDCPVTEEIEDSWTIYFMSQTIPSTITGTGDLAGTVLNLSHAPSNGPSGYPLWGFQVGEMANNANCNFGAWAYFYYQDSTDSAAPHGTGSINLDLANCSNNILGCTDSNACNYNPNAGFDDSSCDFSCLGCTNECAPNYDPDASLDDGSCSPVIGCRDASACNYDPCADTDGDCYTVDACGICGGSGQDIDNDGLCDDADGCTDLSADNFDASLFPPGSDGCLFSGCTDSNANNYDPDANLNVGCEYNGCTDPGADNFDPNANVDDGSCIFEGCTEAAACNYWAEANVDDGSCNYSCYGCTDSSACNFDSEATIEDGSCDFSCFGCTSPCAPNYDDTATLDDGSCQPVVGCMDDAACSFDPCADTPGSCDYLDECGVCGGQGIPAGNCDCNGNQIDECGVCGGEGIPDGDCDCNGNVLDACGVCGGSGVDVDQDGLCDDLDGCTDLAADNYDAQLNPPGLEACEYIGCTDPNADNYDAQANVDAGCLYTGCTDPEADNYDPQANVAGECIYGGCTDPNSCNYDPDATEDNGNCLYLDVMGICGGGCTSNCDGDEYCDDVDPCIGILDECGLCNGPGAVFECGCAQRPVGDCDCDGNQLDVLGNCGGNCTSDADGDGVCDDVDTCVGTLDSCGVCNGPGAIFECGCSMIPAEDCDCDGQQLDALGDCGGDCTGDADGDGVCDSDEVPGCTEATACNYQSEATDDDGTCYFADGCTDCQGNCNPQPDGDGTCDCAIIAGCTDESACNFNAAATDSDGSCVYAVEGLDCAGNCLIDLDGDGLCDENDDCIGELDACGVCNGPGAIYSCGCEDLLPGACDCDGNMPDAIGVCNGECEADDNSNGICDDVEEALCGPGCSWDPIQGLCIGLDSSCPTDLDGNGATGAADLLIFLSNYNLFCND